MLANSKMHPRTIKSLTFQFSFESDLGQSKSMDRSKHNEPYKHEEEFLEKLNTFLQSENYISITYCAFGKCMNNKSTIILLNVSICYF
jgi:hypothetical protein